MDAVADGKKLPFDRSLLIEQLGRGLRVIEAFSDAHPRLTSTEAGRLSGLTRTAARRHLASLVHFGYAGTDGKHYWLLPRIMRLGRSYLDEGNPRALLRTVVHCHWVNSSQLAGPPWREPLPEAPRPPMGMVPSSLTV